MDLAPVFVFFREASPWAVLIGAIVVIVRMYFTHREKMREEGTTAETHELVHELHTMMTVSAQVGRQSLQLLGKIAQELVSFNASQSGEVVSIENSKIMIENQWNWVRDETARIICNSVENNNFAGNETMVARRARHAWKHAAANPRRILNRIKGMQYPHDSLFEHHLPFIWESVWEWAVPLYHRDLGSATLDDALDDLKARTMNLFDDVIRTYFEMTEDIDRGQLYSSPSDGGMNVRISQAEMAIQEDELKAVSEMVEQLRQYRCDGGSGPHARINPREEMERRERETTDHSADNS